MFGMGMGEILLIAVVALLVLGPDRLPSAAKALGKGIRDLRSQTKDLQQTIEKDTELGDAVRELRGALRGDPETLYERATGQRFSDIHKAPSKPAIPASTASSEAATGDEAATGSESSATEASPPASEPARLAHSASDGASDDEPLAEAAGGDSLEPVIRSAEGVVARERNSDDPSHG